MSKGFIIYCISLISVLCVGIFGSAKPLISFTVFTDVNITKNTIFWLYCLGGIFALYMILTIIFEQRRKANGLNLIETKYNLQLLDNTQKDKYVIKNNGKYIFSFIDENNKKVTCIRKKVKLKITDKEPYLIKKVNEYKPKGGLDFLFYTKKWDEEKNIKYVLYLNNKM